MGATFFRLHNSSLVHKWGVTCVSLPTIPCPTEQSTSPSMGLTTISNAFELRLLGSTKRQRCAWVRLMR